MKEKCRALLLLLLISLLLTRVSRADSLPAVFEETENFQFTILYREGDDGKESISGAGFVCYKAADYTTDGKPIRLEQKPTARDREGNWILIEDRQNMKNLFSELREAYQEGRTERGNVYHGITNAKGILTFDHVDPGIYLVAEETPASFHTASSPFLISIPEAMSDGWNFHPQAEPKPAQTGGILIRKTVKGKAGEVNREFHFKVKIDSDERFQWKRSDGAGGSLKSGEVLELKSGEEVVLEGIPAGLAYEIQESEADQDGYKTTSKNAKGSIVGKKQIEVQFVNSRDQEKTEKENADKESTKKSSGGGKSTASGGSVRTGDQSMPLIWLLILAASMTAAVFLLRKGTRK